MWLMTSNASLTSSTQVDWCLKNLKIPGVFTPGVFFEGHSLVAKFQPDVRSGVSPAHIGPANTTKSPEMLLKAGRKHRSLLVSTSRLPNSLCKCPGYFYAVNTAG